MEDATLRLWFAYLGDTLSQKDAAKCIEMLSAAEKGRLASIKPANARQEYLIGHTLVRNALSCGTAIPPGSLRFRTNGYGKPRLDSDCDLRFNLSHSLELAVCIVCSGRDVGVDTENVSRATEILEIAEDVFSPLELGQLAELRGEERLDRALSLWVLKEAYVKALGTGLSMPLKEFSFVFGDEEGLRLQHDGPEEDYSERWRFCLLEHHDHRIALFADAPDGVSLELWEFRPVLGNPKQLAAPAPLWFPLRRSSL